MYVAYTDAPWSPYGLGGFSAGTGTSFGDASGIPQGGQLYVPQGYETGDVITGSLVLASTSFDTAGLNPGSYVSTFTNCPSSDTITVNVGAPAPIPEAIYLRHLVSSRHDVRRCQLLPKPTQGDVGGSYNSNNFAPPSGGFFVQR